MPRSQYPIILTLDKLWWSSIRNFLSLRNEFCLLAQSVHLGTCSETISVYFFFNVLLTVHLGISLDNDQLDAYLLYFTICPLQPSTCFERYMLIIRRLNFIDAASGIFLSVSGLPVHKLRENCREVLSQPVHRTATDWEDDTRCCINTIQPPDDERVMLETCRGL